MDDHAAPREELMSEQTRRVAHDLNNLLMVILGEAELASSDLPDGSPAAESLEAIQTAGRRAAELVRQLLAEPR
jgi:signal transduction histidine kinase